MVFGRNASVGAHFFCLRFLHRFSHWYGGSHCLMGARTQKAPLPTEFLLLHWLMWNYWNMGVIFVVLGAFFFMGNGPLVWATRWTNGFDCQAVRCLVWARIIEQFLYFFERGDVMISICQFFVTLHIHLNIHVRSCVINVFCLSKFSSIYNAHELPFRKCLFDQFAFPWANPLFNILVEFSVLLYCFLLIVVFNMGQ